jgi:Ser/Thr protein kinase RdoA (MazF antagonist)
VYLPAPVAAALEQAYDVGRWLGWDRLRMGGTNLSLLLRAASGAYVLRQSQARKSPEGIAFELRLIMYLRAHGYPAPVLVPTRGGDAYLEHEGLLYVITRFISGDDYDHDDPRDLAAAGRVFGLYHRIVRGLPAPYYYRPAPSLTGLAATAAACFPEVARAAGGLLPGDERERLERDLAVLRDHVARVEAAVTAVYPTLPSLVIHGSLGPTALIFAGQEVVGVLDYDRATPEVRALDLAYALRALCRVHGSSHGGFWTSFDYGRCRAFLAAYREVERLAEPEVAAVPLVVQGHRLLTVLHKCDNFLVKQAQAPREIKHARRLATILERETIRLRWLEEHGDELHTALAG